MKSNWSNAVRRMTKYQFGLMLVLVGSTVITSAQADLDEKSKVIAEWLVNFTIKTLQISPQPSTRHNAQPLFSGGTPWQ